MLSTIKVSSRSTSSSPVLTMTSLLRQNPRVNNSSSISSKISGRFGARPARRKVKSIGICLRQQLDELRGQVATGTCAVGQFLVSDSRVVHFSLRLMACALRRVHRVLNIVQALCLVALAFVGVYLAGS